jgi:hypothetical protein
MRWAAELWMVLCVAGAVGCKTVELPLSSRFLVVDRMR